MLSRKPGANDRDYDPLPGGDSPLTRFAPVLDRTVGDDGFSATVVGWLRELGSHRVEILGELVVQAIPAHNRERFARRSVVLADYEDRARGVAVDPCPDCDGTGWSGERTGTCLGGVHEEIGGPCPQGCPPKEEREAAEMALWRAMLRVRCALPTKRGEALETLQARARELASVLGKGGNP